MSGVTSAPETGHLTLEGCLRTSLDAFPDKVVYKVDGRSATFAELERGIVAAANALLGLGVQPGDAIGLFADSNLEWLHVWLAAPRIGALTVPINTMFKGEFLAHQLRDSGARIVLASAHLVPNVLEMKESLPNLETVLVLGDAGDTAAAGVALLPATVLAPSADSTDDSSKVDGGTPLAWNAPACVMYTSGTTGPSKGVLVSQHYFLTGAQAVVRAGGWGTDDVLYGAVPLFHGSGLLGLVLPAILSGCTSVIDGQFSVSECWNRIREHGATGFMAVGPMLTMLWSVPPAPDDADNPVKVILAAPIPGPLHVPMEQRWGVRFTTIYGLTEAQPMTVMSVDDEPVPGSAGKASPHFEVRVVDADDEPLPPGEVGEIVCRPKRPHVMFEGYHNRPADTLAQMRNLWFHTGDAGYLDADGNLFFVDRKKDAIRRRGENISSFELELAIAAHPGIAEVAALPVPSPLGEDDVKVCVVLADPATTHVDVMDHCVKSIPRFALPRYIELVTSLPRNATGRVQKFRLREDPFTEATWDRDSEGYVVPR